MRKFLAIAMMSLSLSAMAQTKPTKYKVTNQYDTSFKELRFLDVYQNKQVIISGYMQTRLTIYYPETFTLTNGQKIKTDTSYQWNWVRWLDERQRPIDVKRYKLLEVLPDPPLPPADSTVIIK